MDIRRRLGNNGTHKGQTFYTCSNAAAVDKNKPDSWGWEEQGHYSFDPNTDTPQLFRFPSPAQPVMSKFLLLKVIKVQAIS